MADSDSSASSTLARIAAAIGSAAVATAVLGIIGIQVGLLAPLSGFYVFAAGAVLGGLVTLLLGAVALFVTRGGTDPVGRGRAWLSSGIGLALIAAVVVGGAPGQGLPAINDISTDLDEPPAFAAASRDPDNAGRDMSYPADFIPQVQTAYPDLTAIGVDAAGEDALLQALQAADELGWEIVSTDPESGVFEARQTTAIFRFVDDIVVRIRPSDGGSLIDVRSKSRVGRGDVGANAARIRAFASSINTLAPVASAPD